MNIKSSVGVKKTPTLENSGWREKVVNVETQSPDVRDFFLGTAEVNGERRMLRGPVARTNRAGQPKVTTKSIPFSVPGPKTQALKKVAIGAALGMAASTVGPFLAGLTGLIPMPTDAALPLILATGAGLGSVAAAIFHSEAFTSTNTLVFSEKPIMSAKLEVSEIDGSASVIRERVGSYIQPEVKNSLEV